MKYTKDDKDDGAQFITFNFRRKSLISFMVLSITFSNSDLKYQTIFFHHSHRKRAHNNKLAISRNTSTYETIDIYHCLIINNLMTLLNDTIVCNF